MLQRDIQTPHTGCHEAWNPWAGSGLTHRGVCCDAPWRRSGRLIRGGTGPWSGPQAESRTTRALRRRVLVPPLTSVIPVSSSAEGR